MPCCWRWRGEYECLAAGGGGCGGEYLAAGGGEYLAAGGGKGGCFLLLGFIGCCLLLGFIGGCCLLLGFIGVAFFFERAYTLVAHLSLSGWFLLI